MKAMIGQRADPGGTAIPGRHMKGLEQAPRSPPLSKTQLIPWEHMAPISDIKLIRTDTTL